MGGRGGPGVQRKRGRRFVKRLERRCRGCAMAVAMLHTCGSRTEVTHSRPYPKQLGCRIKNLFPSFQKLGAHGQVKKICSWTIALLAPCRGG